MKPKAPELKLEMVSTSRGGDVWTEKDQQMLMRLEKVNLGPFKVDYDELMALRRRNLALFGCVVIEQKPEEPKPEEPKTEKSSKSFVLKA